MQKAILYTDKESREFDILKKPNRVLMAQVHHKNTKSTSPYKMQILWFNAQALQMSSIHKGLPKIWVYQPLQKGMQKQQQTGTKGEW